MEGWLRHFFVIGLFLRKKDSLWIVEKQKVSYLCWCSSNMLEVHDRKKGVSLKEYEFKIVEKRTQNVCLEEVEWG